MTDVLVPPVLWRVGEQIVSEQVLSRAIDAGADWFYLPAIAAELPEALARATHDGEAELIVGVTVEQLLTRSLPPVFQHLPRGACAAVLLEDATAGDLKGGRPFHRLMQLRDSGRARLVMLNAADALEAEWMIENTPAHAITLPYGPADQTARYRVFASGAENGTALIARDPDAPPAWPHDPISPADALAFCAAAEAIAAMIQPTPQDLPELQAILHALWNPMPAPQRDRWWTEFSQHVPEPPKPRSGHPPE